MNNSNKEFKEFSDSDEEIDHNHFALRYPDYHEIVEGVYLGSEDSAQNINIIRKHEIRAICVCGSDLKTPFKDKKMKGRFQSIEYRMHEIPDYEEAEILSKFDDNNKWIQSMVDEGRTVLFHCKAGLTRSPSFVIAYLMKSRNWGYNEAYRHVEERRFIYLLPGFKEQLKKYEQQLKQQKE